MERKWVVSSYFDHSACRILLGHCLLQRWDWKRQKPSKMLVVVVEGDEGEVDTWQDAGRGCVAAYVAYEDKGSEDAVV